MAEDARSFTHTAYTRQRIGKKFFGPWIELGSGWLDDKGAGVFLRVLPIGGFTGYIRLWPKGEHPPIDPSPAPEPQRPGEPPDHDGDMQY